MLIKTKTWHVPGEGAEGGGNDAYEGPDEPPTWLGPPPPPPRLLDAGGAGGALEADGGGLVELVEMFFSTCISCCSMAEIWA